MFIFSVKLLEYDKRFAAVAKDDFIFYDYKSPMSFGQMSTGAPKECFRESFDIVIADPPFLSEECFAKTAVTIKYLAKEEAKLLVCTGKQGFIALIRYVNGEGVYYIIHLSFDIIIV